MPPDLVQLIHLHLEHAQIQALRAKKCPRLKVHMEAIGEALKELNRLRMAYREALADQAQSVRVKQIAENLADLETLLPSFGDRPLTADQQNEAQNRIKTWHHESRRWLASLPLQPCLRRLPAREGEPAEARVQRLWLAAGGAWFAPPPHASRPLKVGTPAQFAPLTQAFPPLLDPMGPNNGKLAQEALNVRGVSGPPSSWVCQPEPLLELLALAREALEAEIGGPNLGGHAPFEQRRRKDSLKTAFAFTCVRIFEKAVGPKTARQGDALRRGSNETSFDHFVALVHRWVAGPDAPPEWEPGLQPIRKAIATQRAWQKLLKVAKCQDEDTFNALPQELQEAAVRKLPEKVRLRLTPPAPPLI
jgi:hypothetical protein